MRPERNLTARTARHALDFLAHQTLHERRQIVFQPVLQHRAQHFGGHILDRAPLDAVENLCKLAERTGDLRTGSGGKRIMARPVSTAA